MYDERLKDLKVNKVVNVHDVREGRIVQVDLYGEKLDGTTAWVQIHIEEDCVFTSSYADYEGSIPIPKGGSYKWVPECPHHNVDDGDAESGPMRPHCIDCGEDL